MSAAAADAQAAGEVAPKKGKKKLIIMIAGAVLVLAIGGGAAFFLLKKPAAEEEGEGGEHAAQVEKAEAEEEKEKTPPVFVPLDPFVVNLADAEVDRFVQVGITLQVIDAHVGDELKLYLPAIRNNILLLLARKTSADLASAEGKDLLAKQIRRAAVEPLGFKLPDPETQTAKEAAAADAKKKKKKEAAKKKNEHEVPVSAVLFSSFVIQ